MIPAIPRPPMPSVREAIELTVDIPVCGLHAGDKLIILEDGRVYLRTEGKVAHLHQIGTLTPES